MQRPTYFAPSTLEIQMEKLYFTAPQNKLHFQKSKLQDISWLVLLDRIWQNSQLQWTGETFIQREEKIFRIDTWKYGLLF